MYARWAMALIKKIFFNVYHRVYLRSVYHLAQEINIVLKICAQNMLHMQDIPTKSCVISRVISCRIMQELLKLVFARFLFQEKKISCTNRCKINHWTIFRKKFFLKNFWQKNVPKNKSFQIFFSFQQKIKKSWKKFFFPAKTCINLQDFLQVHAWSYKYMRDLISTCVILQVLARTYKNHASLCKIWRLV